MDGLKFILAMFLVIVAIMVLLSGCGSIGVRYKYYGLDTDAKYLRGPKPENDLPLEVCSPTLTSKSPCVVMFADEFFLMKTDLQESKDRLQDAMMND